MQADAARAAVLDALETWRDEVVEDAAGLVRIPSTGGSDAEHDAQAHLAGRWAAADLDVDHWRIDLARLARHPDFPGMEVERDEAWGVVGRLAGTEGAGASGPSSGPSLLFNGHVDVVPTGDPAAWSDDPFAATVRDGRLFGRGSCDMKAGLVAAQAAVLAVRRSGVRLRGDLLLAAVQGEEDGGMGSFALLERGWRAAACVIAEPTSLDVIPANSGALTFRLRVRGRATHAASRWDGISAIERFWPVWQALQALEARRHARVDPLMARWPLAHPLSIGTVRAGDWASSVPDLLVAEGRLGVALDEPVDAAKAALEEAVATACAADPWLRGHPVEVEWWGGQFASGRLAPDSDLIARVQAAHRAVTGSRADVYGAPYGSDLRLLGGLGGIPTLQYGPGDVQLAHGPLESVALDEVHTTARTLALLALDVCGVA